ncbi:hypothetical protein CUS60_13200 [Enterococcus faecium]|nr:MULTISPECIES: hypothetical protein [Enterococcus]ELA93076.1 hypothetical protein OI9_05334 [Enterococcus faecium EnGen0001]EME3491308.1 hypothetical protein [Enterococcus faecium]EME3519496.1 hypothetical protein [Enterococcus faecium]EME8092074.1 hypothetical protein [Enterococcus faecium]EMF0400817.1 hypothetical protein [Enterococcus faecium]
MYYKDSQVTYKELAQLTLRVGKHCLKKEEGKEYIRKTKLTSDGHNDKIAKHFQTVLISLSLSKKSQWYLGRQGTFRHFDQCTYKEFLNRKMKHSFNTFFLQLFTSTLSVYDGKFVKNGMFNFISAQANMGLSFDNLEKTDFILLSKEEYFREWEFINLLFAITEKLSKQLEKRDLSEKNEVTRQFNRNLAIEYIQFMEKSIVDYFRCHNIQLIDDKDITDDCILTEFDKQSQAFEHYLDDFEKKFDYKRFISQFRHIIIEWWMPTLCDKLANPLSEQKIQDLIELLKIIYRCDTNEFERLIDTRELDRYRTIYISDKKEEGEKKEKRKKKEKDLIFPLDKENNLEFKEEIYKYLTKPGYRKR